MGHLAELWEVGAHDRRRPPPAHRLRRPQRRRARLRQRQLPRPRRPAARARLQGDRDAGGERRALRGQRGDLPRRPDRQGRGDERRKEDWVTVTPRPRGRGEGAEGLGGLRPQRLCGRRAVPRLRAAGRRGAVPRRRRHHRGRRRTRCPSTRATCWSTWTGSSLGRQGQPADRRRASSARVLQHRPTAAATCSTAAPRSSTAAAGEPGETIDLLHQGRTVLRTQQANAANIRAFASGLAEVSGALRSSDGDVRAILQGGPGRCRRSRGS